MRQGGSDLALAVNLKRAEFEGILWVFNFPNEISWSRNVFPSALGPSYWNLSFPSCSCGLLNGKWLPPFEGGLLVVETFQNTTTILGWLYALEIRLTLTKSLSSAQQNSTIYKISLRRSSQLLFWLKNPISFHFLSLF